MFLMPPQGFGYRIFQPLQPNFWPQINVFDPQQYFTPRSQKMLFTPRQYSWYNITNVNQVNRQKQQTNNVQFSTNKQKNNDSKSECCQVLISLVLTFGEGVWNWVVLGAAGTSFWVAGFNLSLATQANPTPVQIRIFRFYFLLKFNCFTTYEAEMTNH